MTIEAIESNLKKILPGAYKNFIHSIEDYEYLSYNEFPDEFPDDEGASWFFWGENRLHAIVEIEGIGKSPAYGQLKLYATLDRNMRKRDYAPTINGTVELNRVEEGFSIAEDNGDLLYLDLIDGGSVWIYFHDSGEVKWVEKDFESWLAKAKK